MRREYNVLSLLHAAYPRAPLGLHYCPDESVIGAHFLVSEYRSGVVVWDHVPDLLQVGEEPGRRIGLAVVDALADLHLVDPTKCGLDDLGRPAGYLRAAGSRLAGTLGGRRPRRSRHPGPGGRAAGPASA